MRTVTLTDDEITDIKDALQEAHNMTGYFDVLIGLRDDLLIVQATGWVDLEGYEEPGTGYWVEEHREAGLSLTGNYEDEDVIIDSRSEDDVFQWLMKK